MRSEFPYKQLFEDYLGTVRNYSKHTLKAYSNDVNQFFVFMDFDDSSQITEVLSSRYARAWVRDLASDKLSAKSIHRKLSSLRTYLKCLKRNNHVDVGLQLDVQLPKIKKAIPSYVKVKDMNALLEQLSIEANDFESQQRLLIISSFYHLGLRRAELINLQIDKVDFSKSEIKVLGKGNKERIVPVTQELKELLDTHFKFRKEMNIPGPYVFSNSKGKPLGEKWIYSMINKALGSTYADKKSPHVLRHSFATHLLQNGADINAIKELLGHSSLSATQLYAHNDIKQLKKVYEQAHPFS